MNTTYGQTIDDAPPEEGSPAAPEHAAALFVVLQSELPLAGGSRHLLSGVRRVAFGRGRESEALRPGRTARADLELSLRDPRMSQTHALLTLVRGRYVLEDADSRNGTYVNGERITQTELDDGDLLEMGHSFLLFRQSVPVAGQPDVHVLPTAPSSATLLPGLELELARLKRVATSENLAVLIEGETGTGKEVLARQVAQWSKRAGPFVGVNCGAIAETLMESELFGAVKGAFSGADRARPGLIRSAHEGCLFLDEIAELTPSSQTALLRVLQEREVTPVGGTRPERVDIKVISATHQNLDAAVQAGRFRRDLFARIAGFRTRIPALRERREDIGLILGRLLLDNPQTTAAPWRLSPAASRRLLQHGWPFNVRELANALDAAMLLSVEGVLEIQPQSTEQGSYGTPEPLLQLDPRQEAHRAELVDALSRHSGNVSAVARELGKARMQVQRWLKRYELDPETFRS